jgi:hypothetical protein
VVTNVKGGTLRVFENMVLRRIFGSKAVGCRKLHNKDLHNCTIRKI